MAQEIHIVLPKLGESILSATVVQWFKKEGDRIQEDEPLLEVTTDKVNSEIPSTVSGTLKKIMALPDEEIGVGDVLAIVTIMDNQKQHIPIQPIENAPLESRSHSSMQGYFSPAVMKIAFDFGLTMDQLMKIEATGEGGRLSKKDVETYLNQTKAMEKSTSLKSGSMIEKIKMSSMRKAIADNMVKSFYQAPHASLITEVDVTEIIKYISKVKESFFQEHGYKITVTTFIAQAIAKAALEFPMINSSLEEEMIVMKRFVNLGIAVSVDQGVMVPVIKRCHELTIEELALALADLAKKGREGGLKIEDTKEGTMTMTNFGMSGTLIGIPIIRYPEVAIVGVGAIHKKVAVLEGDLFGVRSMVYMSLTFDHRVIDGIYGCEFLKSVKNHLENFVV